MQNRSATAARNIDSMTADAVGLCQSGKLADGIGLLREIVEMAPENANNTANLGSALCQSGNLEEGVACLEKAFALARNDPGIRQNYINGLVGLYQRSVQAENYPDKLRTCRKLLELLPGNADVQIDLYTALSDAGAPAEITDFGPHLATLNLGKKIFIACMPKSGSSWLFSALMGLSGYPGERFAQAYVQNEQEIYLPKVIGSATKNGVIQQHCRATDPNIAILQAFGIRPVVLVRNLLDALVSMHDFYDAGAVRNTFHAADWADLDASTRLDLMADTVAPWYVEFFASWTMADKAGKLPVLWLGYEDMIADKAGALKRTLGHYGLRRPMPAFGRRWKARTARVPARVSTRVSRAAARKRSAPRSRTGFAA